GEMLVVADYSLNTGDNDYFARFPHALSGCADDHAAGAGDTAVAAVSLRPGVDHPGGARPVAVADGSGGPGAVPACAPAAAGLAADVSASRQRAGTATGRRPAVNGHADGAGGCTGPAADGDHGRRQPSADVVLADRLSPAAAVAGLWAGAGAGCAGQSRVAGRAGVAAVRCHRGRRTVAGLHAAGLCAELSRFQCRVP